MSMEISTMTTGLPDYRGFTHPYTLADRYFSVFFYTPFVY